MLSSSLSNLITKGSSGSTLLTCDFLFQSCIFIKKIKVWLWNTMVCPRRQQSPNIPGTANSTYYAHHEHFKRLFLYNTFLKETHLRNQHDQTKFVNACRRKCRKWMDGRTESQTDIEWWHSNLIYIVHLTKSYEKLQLNISKHVGEKCGKLCISSILSPKGALLLQKLMRIDDTSTWSAVQ